MPIEPFHYDLAELRERFEECADGGGDEHFAALVLFGTCPYCGLDDDEAASTRQDRRDQWGELMPWHILLGVAVGAVIWWLVMRPFQLNEHERRRRRMGLLPQRELPEDKR